MADYDAEGCLIPVVLIVLIVLVLWGAYSCEDSQSQKRMAQCKSSKLFQAVSEERGYRIYYIYKCDDGSMVRSSVLIPEGQSE
jgi:hypothetical protein